MVPEQQFPARDAAQQIAYDAMEASDEAAMAQLCRQALEIYPDCVDALAMLARIECPLLADYVEAMRRAVDAGRRDLGHAFIEETTGVFWLEITTRPYMRAMALLADALLKLGQPQGVDEAIGIHERMLELNPDDNQGVRDPLVGGYLHRKRYTDAARLLGKFGDGMAIALWSRVLLDYVTEGDGRAARSLKKARKQNPFVELYLTGQKRRPRHRVGHYSPGEESEAIYCADTLLAAWMKHPKARRWLKQQCAPGR